MHRCLTSEFLYLTGFYFVDLEDAKIGLPLTELKQGIMVGAEVMFRTNKTPCTRSRQQESPPHEVLDS